MVQQSSSPSAKKEAELDFIPHKVNQIHPSILGGEALAKLKALEEVVGAHMMSPASVVPMQRPLLTTARMRVGGVRSDSLRNAGLAARENRDHRN